MKTKAKKPLSRDKTYYTFSGSRAYVSVIGEDEVLGYVETSEHTELGKWTPMRWTKAGIAHGRGICSWADILYEEWEPEDKELVWAWDHDYCIRKVGFYDAQNGTLFNPQDGKRNGPFHKNYAPYECEWPAWAQEAYNKLGE